MQNNYRRTKEFFYCMMRKAADPGGTLMRFLTTSYETAATAGNWNRAFRG